MLQLAPPNWKQSSPNLAASMRSRAKRRPLAHDALERDNWGEANLP